MQTFLPYPDYKESAKCLDDRRLGKQRIESIDILYINLRNDGKDLRDVFKKSDAQSEYLWKRYKNHPAVRMWRHHNWELVKYTICIIEEWISRGYTDNQLNILIEVTKHLNPDNKSKPLFFGEKEFHDSHKSNLLRKKPEYYKQFNWKVKDNLPYVWMY